MYSKHKHTCKQIYTENTQRNAQSRAAFAMQTYVHDVNGLFSGLGGLPKKNILIYPLITY